MWSLYAQQDSSTIHSKIVVQSITKPSESFHAHLADWCVLSSTRTIKHHKVMVESYLPRDKWTIKVSLFISPMINMRSYEYCTALAYKKKYEYCTDVRSTRNILHGRLVHRILQNELRGLSKRTVSNLILFLLNHARHERIPLSYIY